MGLRNALLIVIPASVLTAVSAAAQNYGDHPHMWCWGWGGMIFGPIMMIVFIALIVGAVVLVLRWMGLGGAPAARGEKDARAILDERSPAARSIRTNTRNADRCFPNGRSSTQRM